MSYFPEIQTQQMIHILTTLFPLHGLCSVECKATTKGTVTVACLDVLTDYNDRLF